METCSIRPATALMVLLALTAATGCGLASGGSPDILVSVTRDFGAHSVGRLVVRPQDSEPTGLELRRRVLANAAGPGVPAPALGGGRWFLYINGIATAGSGPAKGAHAGDRVWWDLHAAGAPASAAVVGSFPEPFRHGTGGRRAPVRVECAPGTDAACQLVLDRLTAAGVPAGRGGLGTGVGQDTLRVLVGPWSVLRGDAAAARLSAGVRTSGVYAHFAGTRLVLLDAAGRAARTLGPGAGLVAAVRFEQQLPTWLVTGGSLAGVGAAARALAERTLQDRFALALDGARAVALPVR